MKKRLICALLATAFAAPAMSLEAPATPPRLAPTVEHAQTAYLSSQLLGRYHYKTQPLDDGRCLPCATTANRRTMIAASYFVAYVGPGGALSGIGTFLALLLGAVLAVVGFVWYPLQRLWRAVRNRPTTAASRSNRS